MFGFDEVDIDQIWQSFLNGDENSFTLFYQQSINRLMQYGYKLSSDRQMVNDCIQEVFIDLYQKKKKTGVKIKKIKPYLFVAIRNGIVKQLTKEEKRKSVSIDDISIAFNVEYSDEQKQISKETSSEIIEKLEKAVVNLPAKQKEIVYLKFEEGLDYDDIADIMNITVESARKSMYRALLSLRKLLDKTLY
jgi:RNA polymerase sigma factor (sigma-70 family)